MYDPSTCVVLESPTRRKMSVGVSSDGVISLPICCWSLDNSIRLLFAPVSIIVGVDTLLVENEQSMCGM